MGNTGGRKLDFLFSDFNAKQPNKQTPMFQTNLVGRRVVADKGGEFSELRWNDPKGSFCNLRLTDPNEKFNSLPDGSRNSLYRWWFDWFS